jgi:hypothetical protein
MKVFEATDLIECQGKEIFVMAVERHSGGWILYTEREWNGLDVDIRKSVNVSGGGWILYTGREWNAEADADYEINDRQVCFQGKPIRAVLKAKISSSLYRTNMQEILEAWGIHPMDLSYPPSSVWEEVADKVWDRVYTNLVPFEGDEWLTYEEMEAIFLECARAVVEEHDSEEDDDC